MPPTMPNGWVHVISVRHLTTGKVTFHKWDGAFTPDEITTRNGKRYVRAHAYQLTGSMTKVMGYSEVLSPPSLPLIALPDEISRDAAKKLAPRPRRM
jgi:hypothetical protein